MLETEFGGMEEVLTELTHDGDPEHLRLARLFDHRSVFDPLARGEDALDGLHANTQIPKHRCRPDCEVTGETRYARSRRRSGSASRSTAPSIGGHSEDEHFSPVATLAPPRRVDGRDLQHLQHAQAPAALLQRDAPTGGWNFTRWALQSHPHVTGPRPGVVTYYDALRPGLSRSYSTSEDSFWCCMGTGMENHARYGEFIYPRRAALS